MYSFCRMAEVRSILAASPFLFQSSWARVISGEEEGVFGWISVNYQLGLLSNTSGVANITQGALDFGGASTQVTMAPVLGVDLLAGSYQVELSGGVSAQLYTHSYLYYGMVEAQVGVVNLLRTLNGCSRLGFLLGATEPHCGPRCILCCCQCDGRLFNASVWLRLEGHCTRTCRSPCRAAVGNITNPCYFVGAPPAVVLSPTLGTTVSLTGGGDFGGAGCKCAFSWVFSFP